MAAAPQEIQRHWVCRGCRHRRKRMAVLTHVAFVSLRATPMIGVFCPSLSPLPLPSSPLPPPLSSRPRPLGPSLPLGAPRPSSPLHSPQLPLLLLARPRPLGPPCPIGAPRSLPPRPLVLEGPISFVPERRSLSPADGPSLSQPVSKATRITSLPHSLLATPPHPYLGFSPLPLVPTLPAKALPWF